MTSGDYKIDGAVRQILTVADERRLTWAEFQYVVKIALLLFGDGAARKW